MAKKREDSLHIPKASAKGRATKTSEIRLERTLIENFVSMQRALVNLTFKLDALTNQTSQLLKIFEESAKSLAKKDFTIEKEYKDTKDILKKLDTLGDQNKIIARGLTILHEGETPPSPEKSPKPPKPNIPSKPQGFQEPSGQTIDQSEMQGYQKSLPVKPE